IANAVAEMKLAQAQNNAAMAAWSWVGHRDNEPCLFGLFFRSAIRHELWRLSGDPFRAGVDFPGSENPFHFTNLNPQSVQPLSEKAAVSLEYASRIMREEPMRPLPPPEPPPTPIEVKPEPPKIDGAIAATPEPQPRKTPKPDYVFHVRFVHMRTSEERTETI